MKLNETKSFKEQYDSNRTVLFRTFSDNMAHT